MMIFHHSKSLTLTGYSEKAQAPTLARGWGSEVRVRAKGSSAGDEIMELGGECQEWQGTDKERPVSPISHRRNTPNLKLGRIPLI